MSESYYCPGCEAYHTASERCMPKSFSKQLSTQTSPVISVSEEAREAAEEEITNAFCRYPMPKGISVQLAINSATEKLTKENEQLKEDVEYLKDRPEFIRYMAMQEIIENESRDWAEDHTALQNLCRKVGCTEQEVNGDSNGVPTVVELAEMLMEKLTKDYDSKKSQKTGQQ